MLYFQPISFDNFCTPIDMVMIFLMTETRAKGTGKADISKNSAFDQFVFPSRLTDLAPGKKKMSTICGR
jgi:hypothetical protein